MKKTMSEIRAEQKKAQQEMFPRSYDSMKKDTRPYRPPNAPSAELLKSFYPSMSAQIDEACGLDESGWQQLWAQLTEPERELFREAQKTGDYSKIEALREKGAEILAAKAAAEKPVEKPAGDDAAALAEELGVDEADLEADEDDTDESA